MSMFKRKGGVVAPVVTPRIAEGVAIATLSLSGNREQSKFIEGRMVEAVKEAQSTGASDIELKQVIASARVRAKDEWATRSS